MSVLVCGAGMSVVWAITAFALTACCGPLCCNTEQRMGMKLPALDLLGLHAAGPCYDADGCVVGDPNDWLGFVPKGSSGVCGMSISDCCWRCWA